MMRTMLWKEYREHRLIWLTMMVVNSGALLGMSRLDETGGFGQGSGKLVVLGPVAVLLVWAYGMICGGMLLAGEREEATLNFLDALPVTRFRLWLVKGQIGLLLLGGQILVMCGVLTGFRAAEVPTLLNGVHVSQVFWPYVLGMLLSGVVGMAYGLFFSARGENVLHTIGLAILGQILASFAGAFLAFVLSAILLIGLHWLAEWLAGQDVGRWSEHAFQNVYTILAFMAYGGLTLAAIVGSARRFSRPDLLRLPASVQRMRSRASMAASWLRLLWLCDRQMRRMALGVLAFSLGLGVVFLVAGPLTWPIVTLFLGVLCGVTVFADEQVNGSFRFLGDQRLPLGRIWIIKTGARFALLLLASFLVLLPSLLVAIYHNSEHSPSRERGLLIVIETLHLNLIVVVVPLLPYLLLWLLYGFSAGQLCGLLSRKAIVAAMIALMLSAGLAIVWVPSLAGIGLHLWQVAGPPLILLATAAFLVRAWAANRLASWQTYLGVSTAMAASLLWMVFGVWYRVVEVPDVPEPFDVAAYKASLPPLEENEAGQVIRGTWGRVESVMSDMRNQPTKPPLFQQCSEVLKDGWPEGESELGEWMDKAFEEDWLQSLSPLPDLPLGMAADPRLLTLRSNELNKWHSASNLSMVLAARGLQQQARGDPIVFVKHMRIDLALSRNLLHHAHSNLARFEGRAAERIWPAAVDPWLRKLQGRPDLLRHALQTLIDHEANRPDEEEQFRADYLIARNTLMDTPEVLLDEAIPHLPSWNDEYRATERHIAAVLWLFPWEQERHQRLLRVEFGGNPQELRKSREWGGRAFEVLGFSRMLRDRQRRPLQELADLRVCRLKVALRLYQEENGELPATLEALVPRYMKSLPRDPFSGQPFRYRRSRGEWIIWPERNQPGHMAPPGGMAAPPGEVPVMPFADEPAAPAEPAMPAAPRDGAGMAAGGMAGRADEGLPPIGGVPFMPRADEPAELRPPRRMLGGGMAGMPGMPGEGGGPGGGHPPTRYIRKGQGILWSVGEDGQDEIYLVPPPP